MHIIKKTSNYVINKAMLIIIAGTLLITSISLYFSPSFVVSASSTSYAKATSSNVKLYRSTTGNEEFVNVYFIIPQTYFVEISDCDNENFYTAKYIDIVGYVKRTEVQCVKGMPITPYANNVSFRMFIPGGIDLRSSPTQSEGLNTIANIQYLETNLKYYGSIDGEEAISYRSTEWYFCKYSKNGTTQMGYIYCAFCDLLTTIPSNTEVMEYTDTPEFSTKPTSSTASGEEVDSMSSLPSATQIIIIVAVCLPCIVIIYLLFRPTKITARALGEAVKSKSKTKRIKSKHLKHQDYYEYDE